MNHRRLAIVLLILLLWGRFHSDGGSIGSPCPGQGFHALVIEDRLQRGSLPVEQLAAITSVEINDLVEAKGGQLKVYDQSQDVSQMEDWIQKAMSLPRDSLPWLVLDNNGRGTSRPAPKNIPEFKALLESY